MSKRASWVSSIN